MDHDAEDGESDVKMSELDQSRENEKDDQGTSHGSVVVHAYHVVETFVLYDGDQGRHTYRERSASVTHVCLHEGHEDHEGQVNVALYRDVFLCSSVLAYDDYLTIPRCYNNFRPRN